MLITNANERDIFEAFYKTSEFVFPKFIFSEFAFLKTSISLHPRGSNERAEHPSFPQRTNNKRETASNCILYFTEEHSTTTCLTALDCSLLPKMPLYFFRPPSFQIWWFLNFLSIKETFLSILDPWCASQTAPWNVKIGVKFCMTFKIGCFWNSQRGWIRPF